jgi:hypothetical protein
MSKKPPLGLKPKRFHDAERLREVKDALIRYLNAGLKAPKEWYAEYEELIKLKLEQI